MRADVDVLDVPVVEAFGMLIEAHSELLNAVTRRSVAASSIPVPWFGVLLRLARSPEHRLRMSELARDMTMSTSGLTRLIDRMEEAGLVERRTCPEDRRGLWATMTPEGEKLVATAAPGHVADLDELLDDALSARQLAQLTGLLRTVRDHVRGLSTD